MRDGYALRIEANDRRAAAKVTVKSGSCDKSAIRR